MPETREFKSESNFKIKLRNFSVPHIRPDKSKPIYTNYGRENTLEERINF